MHEEAVSLFNQADVDKDGHVTIAEAEALFQKEYVHTFHHVKMGERRLRTSAIV